MAARPLVRRRPVLVAGVLVAAAAATAGSVTAVRKVRDTAAQSTDL